MVLEGAVFFDLKANILISEQALGNKSEYLFCLCSFFFFVLQILLNVVLLKGYSWSNILQGNGSYNST